MSIIDTSVIEKFSTVDEIHERFDVCVFRAIHSPDDGPCECAVSLAGFVDKLLVEAENRGIRRASIVARKMAEDCFQAAEGNEWEDLDVMESLEEQGMTLDNCSKKILALIPGSSS